MSLLAAFVLAALQTPDPADPAPARRGRAVRSDVHVFIEESPQGDYEHPYYEQRVPVEYESATGNLRSRVWYRTACRPQDEDRVPIFLALPQPSSPPVTLSGAFGAPTLTVSSGGGGFTTVTGRNRNDPIITKPSSKPALFGASSGSTSSSDLPYLYGPDLDVVLAADVSEWAPARWMPEGTSFRVYGRALFGSFEVFDTPTSLQLYGVGPRLAVPIATVGGLAVEATLSAGPAFLHTGIGDALGFDGGIGLKVEHRISDAVTFVAAVEANLYFSENVTAFGPVVNVGLNVGW